MRVTRSKAATTRAVARGGARMYRSGARRTRTRCRNEPAFLCRQDAAHPGRLQRRRRLRPLCARTRALFRAPPAGKSRRRGPEHGGRGQPQGGELSLQRRAARRHRARDLRARHRVRAADRPPRRRPVRRAENQLDRQRVERSKRLRDQRLARHPHLAGHAGQAERDRRPRVRAPTATCSRSCFATCSTCRCASSPAIRAAPISTSPWSAARSTGAAAGRGTRS